MTIIESGNLPDRPFFMSIQKREVPLLCVYKNGSSFLKRKMLGTLGSFVHGFMRIFKPIERNDILSVRRWGY